MQIVCPNCATTYEVKPATIGASGRSVRCARCRTVWVAMPEPEPAPALAEPALIAASEPVAEAEAEDDAPKQQAAAAEMAHAGEFDWSLTATRMTEAEFARDASAAEQEAADAAWPDADVDTVDGAPSLVPAQAPDKADPHVAAEPDNIENVAARRAPKAKKRRKWNVKLKVPRPGMPVAAAMLAAVLAGLLLGRAKVVAAMPQTASLFSTVGLPVNLRGLVFEDVRTTGEMHEGVPVLIVEGTIANVTGKSVEVPRLRFAMRNRAGQEIYAWTSVSGRSTLAPGETVPFRTRLASPPADGRDVVVRFFHRRDFIAGMR
jgi:predicted Zn finger-like uncharacterized protein